MKVLVLGIGNIMFSDEGVGVHIAQMIKHNYKFSSNEHSIEFIDGGTLANLLIPIICEHEYVFIIDCIDANDGLIGDVYFFDFNDLPKSVNFSGSAHEVEMLQTLQMMELIGDRPQTKIIGIIPKRVEPMSFELSKEIMRGVGVAEKTLLKELSALGFTYEKVANLSVCDIAKNYSKGKDDISIQI